jgi:hypothetical protein
VRLAKRGTRAGQGFSGTAQTVAGEERAQGGDVPCLRLADVPEGRDLAEVGDHLVVGGPRLVLVVERLVEGADLGIRKVSHR